MRDKYHQLQTEAAANAERLQLHIAQLEKKPDTEDKATQSTLEWSSVCAHRVIARSLCLPSPLIILPFLPLRLQPQSRLDSIDPISILSFPWFFQTLSSLPARGTTAIDPARVGCLQKTCR